MSWQWKSAVNSALIYYGDTGVDSESSVKENNFVLPNETTVVESRNVLFFVSVFVSFGFLIVAEVMLTAEKPTGNVLSCLR